MNHPVVDKRLKDFLDGLGYYGSGKAKHETGHDKRYLFLSILALVFQVLSAEKEAIGINTTMIFHLYLPDKSPSVKGVSYIKWSTSSNRVQFRGKSPTI